MGGLHCRSEERQASPGQGGGDRKYLGIKQANGHWEYQQGMWKAGYAPSGSLQCGSVSTKCSIGVTVLK